MLQILNSIQFSLMFVKSYYILSSLMHSIIDSCAQFLNHNVYR